MLTMPHLDALTWDFTVQLKSSAKTDETTHYVYSDGERVRKVVMDTSGTPRIKYERIYLGGYEIYREYDVSENLDLERATHKAMDDKRMVALLEVKTVEGGTAIDNSSQVTITRYQYTNHLDSASLELDENAEVISYEEYHPFGTTSYSMHTNDSEVSAKRYRYVHKELDTESGLYYYGARYYAAWLCRFVSVDPLKDKYPFYTTYQYAGNKPIIAIDVDGMESNVNIGQQAHIIENDNTGVVLPDYASYIYSGDGVDYDALTEGGIIPHEWWSEPDSSMSPALAGFIDEGARTVTGMLNLLEGGFYGTMTMAASFRGPAQYTSSPSFIVGGEASLQYASGASAIMDMLRDPSKLYEALETQFTESLGAIEGESISDAYIRGALTFQALTAFVGAEGLQAISSGRKVSKELVDAVMKKVDADLADLAKLSKLDSPLSGKTIIVDENLSPTLVHMFEKQGFTTKRFAKGTTDPEIGKWARENDAFVLTNNRKDIGRASGFGNAQAIYVSPSLTSGGGRVDLVRRMVNFASAAQHNPDLLQVSRVNLLDY